MTGPKIPEIDQKFRDRYTTPHCDSSVLHAPGVCQYCDKYPDWQYYRSLANIAFTGAENELGGEHTAPCPSTHFRKPEARDQWPGNTTTGYTLPPLYDPWVDVVAGPGYDRWYSFKKRFAKFFGVDKGSK